MPLPQELRTIGGELSWEDRLRRTSGRSRMTLKPEYQELKFTLHRKLLDKINLEALATIDNQRVRGEVRAGPDLADRRASRRCSARSRSSRSATKSWTKSSAWGRSSRCCRTRPSRDILVNTHKQVYVERKGLLELTNVTFRDDQHLLRIIDKIVSQVGRRVDESTPMVDARLSRRLARQRHHSAAGGRRPAAVHPPFRHRQADARRPGRRRAHDRRA